MMRLELWVPLASFAVLLMLNIPAEAQPGGSNAGPSSAGNIRCPGATLTNEAPDLREAFRLAMADACSVLESGRFRSAVEDSRLARKCPLLPFKKHKRLPGPEIYRKLSQGMPDSITVTAEKVGWRSTIAVTNAAKRSITIKPERFDGWLGRDGSTRAELVNTLVHEMTHLVEPAPGDGYSYFQDGGQWTPWCNEDLLVSYALGDKAQEQWTAAHPGA